VRRVAVAGAFVAALIGLAAPAARAQQGLGGLFSDPVAASPVLVVELDRLFAESAFGLRIAAEIEEEGSQLAAENRRIEAELIAEERQITEQRPGLTPEAFRALADAFDEKVQTFRREQDAKVRAIGQRNEEGQRAFLTAAQPVLQDLMTEAGATVLLDRRVVFLSAPAVDVTDAAIERIDAAIGDGSKPTP
jgi:Skp family chaperone for outer membrane proteins